MATSERGKILEALFNHLSGLTTTPATQIVWQGRRSHTPLPPYLEVQHLSGRTGSPTLADTRDIRGMMQVTLVYASTGEGPGIIKPTDLVDQVTQRFAKNTEIWAGSIKVSIPKWPSDASPIIEGDQIRIPVTIEYLASIGD